MAAFAHRSSQAIIPTEHDQVHPVHFVEHREIAASLLQRMLLLQG